MLGEEMCWLRRRVGWRRACEDVLVKTCLCHHVVVPIIIHDVVLHDYTQRPPSYLYKTVVPGNPLDDAKLLVETVGSLLRANALRPQTGPGVTFGQKAKEELEAKEKALA